MTIPLAPISDSLASAANGLARASRHWLMTRDGDRRALALYERHYSCRPLPRGRTRRLFVGPGQKTVLITPKGDALLTWRKFLNDSGQTGVNCAVFRNEGEVLSSLLIREGMDVAWSRWPGARLYTYVDARKVGCRNGSSNNGSRHNPGYCFLKAGWSRCGHTKSRGLLILECLPPPETN